MFVCVVIMITGLLTAIRAEDKSYDVVLGTDIHMECLINTGAPNNAEWTWTKNGGSLVDCGVPGRLHIDVTTKWFVDIKEVEICDIGTYKCCTTVAGTVCNQHTVRAEDKSYDVALGTELHMKCFVNMGAQIINNADTTWTKNGGSLAACGVPGRLHIDVDSVDIKEVEICDIGTYKCCTTIASELICHQHTVRVLVFRGVSGKLGGSNELYDLWMNSKTANTDDKDASKIGGNSSLHYKSEMVEKWTNYDIDNVKLSVYANGVEKAYFIFNGSATNKKTWMSGERLIQSSYTDVVGYSTPASYSKGYYVSLQGTKKRKFFINKQTGSCKPNGWLMVITQQIECQWWANIEPLPNIMYSPTTESSYWKNGHYADELIISLLLKAPMQCMCPCENVVQNTQQFYASLKYYEKEELLAILQPMLRTTRKAMAVNKSNTSKHQRKLYSAPDSRGSSQLLGITGITVICIIFGLIVLIDVTSICRRLRIDVESIRRRFRFLGVPQND